MSKQHIHGSGPIVLLGPGNEPCMSEIRPPLLFHQLQCSPNLGVMVWTAPSASDLKKIQTRSVPAGGHELIGLQNGSYC